MKTGIKNAALRRFFWYAFRIVGKMHMPGLGSLFFLWSLEHIVKRPGGKKCFRLLILNKESFAEDVMSTFGDDDGFEIYSIDVVNNKALKAMSWAFLPDEIGDNNYVSEKKEIIKGKKEYRDFLKKFWLNFKSRLSIDAVLTANFSYYAERELAAALEELGTPFIVLHKENLKSPGRVEFFKELYRLRRGPFLGRKIFVYNDIEKTVQIESGVTTPDRIIVTGMPRLDRIHEWRKRKSKSSSKSLENTKQVLFFSFGPKTGLPSIARRKGSGINLSYESISAVIDSLSWKNLVQKSHGAIIRLAKDNPDIKIIIKAKGRFPESSALFDALGESVDIPSNVKIVVGGEPFDLITQSRVICGFNTTGLLEAIAAGKPVIVPWFEEARDEVMHPYIVDLEEAVEYAESPDDLVIRLKGHALADASPVRELNHMTQNVLDKWLGNSDGLAGKRVRKVLMNEINKSH